MDAPPPVAHAPAWRIARACVTGTTHRLQGSGCQDRFAVEQIRSPCGESVVIAAVADGASSASQSATGAGTAVNCFLDGVVAALTTRVAALPDDAAQHWLCSVRDRVLAQAAQAARPPGDYASTFLGVVAGEDASIFIQLGDGLIAVRQAQASHWALGCTPQRGEYVNETWFLTSPDALARADIRRMPGPLADLALSTDGLESTCLDRIEGRLSDGFFDHLVATLRSAPDASGDQLDAGLARFLDSSALDAYTGDDKTLVLATRWDGGP